MKIPRAAKGKSGPWMTIAEAALWIDPELSASGVWWDDMDGERFAAALILVHRALEGGTLEGFGVRPSGEVIPIEAAEWAERRAIGYERSWAHEPYVRFRVARSDVERLWPTATGASAPRPRGRPPEFQWEAVRRLADRERERGLSRNKIADIVRALMVERGAHPPSATRLKEMMRTWWGVGGK